MHPSYATFLKFHEKELQKQRNTENKGSGTEYHGQVVDGQEKRAIIKYTPYTVKEYKILQTDLLKKQKPTLGANLDTPELLEKRKKSEKVKDFSRSVKLRNSSQSRASNRKERASFCLNDGERSLSSFDTRKLYDLKQQNTRNRRRMEDRSENQNKENALASKRAIPNRVGSSISEEAINDRKMTRIKYLYQQHDRDLLDVSRIKVDVEKIIRTSRR